jgi:hypothetical protein
MPVGSLRSSSAKAGFLYASINFLRLHIGQQPVERLVPFHSYVLFNTLRIDNSAVAKRDALLLFIKLV